MKTFMKILGFAAVGIVAIIAVGALLGFVSWVLSWVIPIAVIAAIGFVVVKLMSAGSKKTPAELQPADAKTEESRTLAAAEKKALSDADAMKMFEDARRKQTESK